MLMESLTGIVYKISNSVNDKIYIGSTTRKLSLRWTEHKKMSKKGSRPLYKEMREFGVDKFLIEVIEVVDVKNLLNREAFWISYYKSYDAGYNISRTGTSCSKFTKNDVNDIIKLSKSGNTLAEISRTYSCDPNTISALLKKNGVNYSNNTKNYILSRGSPVIMLSKPDYAIVNVFSSMNEDARFVCKSENKSLKHVYGIAGHIKKSIIRNGTAYGYIWKFKK